MENYDEISLEDAIDCLYEKDEIIDELELQIKRIEKEFNELGVYYFNLEEKYNKLVQEKSGRRY